MADLSFPGGNYAPASGGTTVRDPLTWPVLVVTKNVSETLGAQVFSKVKINTVAVDTANAFDLTNSEYVVPATGTYEINGKLRVKDDTAAMSYGIGMDINLTDTPAFFWAITTTGLAQFNNRNGVFNSRITLLNQGTRLKLYTWLQAASDIIAGELSLYRIS